MSDIDEALKNSKIRFLFHAAHVKYMGDLADAGCVISAKKLGLKKPGSKKDIERGGGAFVYCRYIVENSATVTGQFGTRSNLKDHFYLVVPIEKITDYYWFFSSTDLNGLLPPSMTASDIEQPEKSKIGALKGMVKYPNDKNGEFGLYETLQFCDVSHVVISQANRDKYADHYASLIASINASQQSSNRAKIIIANDGEIAFTRIANG